MNRLKDWDIRKFMSDRQEHFTFIVQDRLEVGYGTKNDVDLEYCEKNEIPAYDQKRVGGTIVFSPGNVTIGWIYNNRVHGAFKLADIIADFIGFLEDKGLNATSPDNDIMVDGGKVASYMGFNFGDKYHWTYEGIQISVNQDIEAIRHICKKEMIKQPKALSEYDITTNEIVEWCKDWCQKHLDIKESEVKKCLESY